MCINFSLLWLNRHTPDTIKGKRNWFGSNRPGLPMKSSYRVHHATSPHLHKQAKLNDWVSTWFTSLTNEMSSYSCGVDVFLTTPNPTHVSVSWSRRKTYFRRTTSLGALPADRSHHSYKIFAESWSLVSHPGSRESRYIPWISLTWEFSRSLYRSKWGWCSPVGEFVASTPACEPSIRCLLHLSCHLHGMHHSQLVNGKRLMFREATSSPCQNVHLESKIWEFKLLIKVQVHCVALHYATYEQTKPRWPPREDFLRVHNSSWGMRRTSHHSRTMTPWYSKNCLDRPLYIRWWVPEAVIAMRLSACSP